VHVVWYINRYPLYTKLDTSLITNVHSIIKYKYKLYIIAIEVIVRVYVSLSSGLRDIRERAKLSV